MGNFIVSYERTGPVPTPEQMDSVLDQLGANGAQILESVWYVGWPGSAADLFDAVYPLLSTGDRLLIAEAADAIWRNLRVTDESLQAAWNGHR